MSEDFAFDSDATLVRVVARLDVGINDPRGLVTISGGAAPPATQSTKSGKSDK